ncbi:MAG TPA: hypothetical protein VFU20_02990 [Sphingomicrobium sp.]|nr:hypothetical protein [Sphingomicrobium sp.]
MVELRRLVAAELASAVDPRVAAMAGAIAALHGKASRAVLFYGSCLREKQLDGLMLDFYLIVSDYRAAYDQRWLAVANRLVPPNVFCFEHHGLTAKYAVLSEDDFARECDVSARTPSVLARFAQPSRLVWAKDDAARTRAVDAVSRAAPALLHLTQPTMSDGEAADPLAIWKKAFAYTYGAELRAERKSRPDAIVEADPERYRQFARAAGFPFPLETTESERRMTDEAWRRFQRRTRRIQMLRLAKASATFTGGVDYIAWKINRHAGTQIRIKPWQRRWPLLAAISLLPRLLRSGAVR